MIRRLDDAHGEPDASKGACPVRKGVIGNVSTPSW